MSLSPASSSTVRTTRFPTTNPLATRPNGRIPLEAIPHLIKMAQLADFGEPLSEDAKEAFNRLSPGLRSRISKSVAKESGSLILHRVCGLLEIYLGKQNQQDGSILDNLQKHFNRALNGLANKPTHDVPLHIRVTHILSAMREFAEIKAHLERWRSDTTLNTAENLDQAVQRIFEFLADGEKIRPLTFDSLTLHTLPPIFNRETLIESLKAPGINEIRKGLPEAEREKLEVSNNDLETWARKAELTKTHEIKETLLQMILDNHAEVKITSICLKALGLDIAPKLDLFPHLTSIDLSSNPLEDFPVGLLSVRTLESITLQDCSISGVDAEKPFQILCGRLKHLDLSCNALDEVPPFIYGLSTLRVLNLSKNNITSLKPDIRFKSLKQLLLETEGGVVVEGKQFLTSLEMLNITADLDDSFLLLPSTCKVHGFDEEEIKDFKKAYPFALGPKFIAD